MKHELRAGILRWLRMLREWVAIGSPTDNSEEWLRDPLSHPAIRIMSMRQLADLTFDRCRIDNERAGPSMNIDLAVSTTEIFSQNPGRSGISAGADLNAHLSRPHTLVTSHILYRLNGQRSSST